MDDQKKLFKALENDDLNTIKSLCANDKLVGNGGTVDLNKINKEYGYTPLSGAVMFGHIDIVTYLCQLPSVDVNARDKNGSTPLCVAAREGHTTITKYLCGIEGVEVNKTDNWGDSPLIIAALLGRIKTLKVLASTKGIDLNLVNKLRGTALCTGARNGNEKVVEYLCTLEDVDVNLAGANGNTPLLLASWYARYRTLNCLVHEQRVDVNYRRNLDGNTALHDAAIQGKEKIAGILLGHENINPKVRNNRGQTPLDIASQNVCSFSIALMLAYINGIITNVNINKQYQDGNTLLHMAVVTENEKAKSYLCGFPEARNVKDKAGKTPFDLAAQSKTCPLSFLLCLYKLPGAEEVDINRRYRENKTLLHIAVKERSSSSLESIISTNGVEINATDINGNTALHYASLDKNRYFFELIVNKEGVNLKKKNNEWLTSLDILSQDEENYPLILESARVQGYNRIAKKRFHNGNTLLHMAVQCENKTAMSDLAKLGGAESIENDQGHTPFDLATMSKNNELLMNFYSLMSNKIEYLVFSLQGTLLTGEMRYYHTILKLAHKFPAIDVNRKFFNANGNTLLHMAVISKNDEELKYLCNLQGAKNIKNDQGKTPFDLASELGSLRYLLYLYSLPGSELRNINQAFRGRKTLLHLAVEEKNLEAVKKLSSTEGIRNHRDVDGNFPFDMAVSDTECHQSFLLYLYRCPGVHLTDINALLRDGKNLLHIAIEEDNNDFTKFLLENNSNINVNVRDSKELSVVHHAILNNKLDTLRILCNHKSINLNLTFDGKMPLEMAIEEKYFEIVSFLLSQKTIDIQISCLCHDDNTRYMVFDILRSVVTETRKCTGLSDFQVNFLDTIDNYLNPINSSSKFIPSLRKLMEYEDPPLLSYLGMHKEDIRLTEDMRVICSAIYNVIVKGLQQYVNHKELKYVLLKKHVLNLSIEDLINQKSDDSDYVIELLKILYLCMQQNNMCTDDRKAFLEDSLKDSDDLGRFQVRLEKIATVGKLEIEGEDCSDARLIAHNILAIYFGKGSSCCSSPSTSLKKADRRLARLFGITKIFHECTIRRVYSVIPCLVTIGIHISDISSDALVGYRTLHGFSAKLGSFMIALVVISVIDENVRSHILCYNEEEHYIRHLLGRLEVSKKDWQAHSNLNSYLEYPWIIRRILQFFWPFKVREPKGPHSHRFSLRSLMFNILSVMMLRPAILRLSVLTHSPINVRDLIRQKALLIWHRQYHTIIEQIPELIIQLYLIQIYFNNIGETGISPTCLTNSTHNFDYKNGNFGCTDNLLGKTESCISTLELYSAIIPLFRIPSLVASVEVSFRKLSPITPKLSFAASYCLYFACLMMVPARLFLFTAIMHSVPDKYLVVGYLIMVCGASFIRNCIVANENGTCLQRVKGTLERLHLTEILSLVLFSIRDVFVISLREPMAYITKPSKVTYDSLRSWKTLVAISLFYFIEGLFGAIYIEYHYPCGVRSSYFMYQGWLYLALLIYSVTVMTLLSYTLHPKRKYILHQKVKIMSLIFFVSGLLLLFVASTAFFVSKESRTFSEKIAVMTIMVLIISALTSTILILNRFGEASKKTKNAKTPDGPRTRRFMSFSTCTSAYEVVRSEP